MPAGVRVRALAMALCAAALAGVAACGGEPPRPAAVLPVRLVESFEEVAAEAPLASGRTWRGLGEIYQDASSAIP